MRTFPNYVFAIGHTIGRGCSSRFYFRIWHCWSIWWCPGTLAEITISPSLVAVFTDDTTVSDIVTKVWFFVITDSTTLARNLFVVKTVCHLTHRELTPCSTILTNTFCAVVDKPSFTMFAKSTIMHAIVIFTGNAAITRDSKLLGGIGSICRYFVYWTFLVAIIGFANAFVLWTTVLKKHFIIGNTTFTAVMIVSSRNYFYRFSLPSSIDESTLFSDGILSITLMLIMMFRD